MAIILPLSQIQWLLVLSQSEWHIVDNEANPNIISICYLTLEVKKWVSILM